MTEEEVFLAALELPDATSRAAYLDEQCAGDAGFRGQVEALLAAHFKSGEFMDVPAPEQIDVEPGFNPAVTILSDGMPAKLDPEVDSEGLQFLAAPSRPDSLGRIGHYEVLQVLGVGGFGIVLRAFDDVLQRVVAVKVMAPQLAATSPARKRFLREARTSAQVRHDNVVQVYEVGEQPLPYLVMEFIPGETLQQRLDRIGPLEVTEVLRIGRQIAEGLAAAHATDLIHRDIKPGNVLLEGGHLKVKITDFGLARAADDASMTQSGMIAGTPMYMAPEQVLGHTLDQRADLFSLGTVLYQMVSGRVPFRAPSSIAVLKRVAEDTPRNIREVIPETPQWLCDIIAKLHSKKPDDRYQSARELADVLADCEEQLKANSKLKDYSRIPRAKSAWSGKRKWAAVAAAVLLPLLALTIMESAGVTKWFRGHQPKIAVGPISSVNLGPAAVDIALPQTDPAAEGFVPLFNGKDLTGWKTNSLSKGDWKVDGGAIDGRGSTSYLFTESGDYANFHLRVEARINGNGDAGVFIRTPFDVRGLPNTPLAKFALLGGYEAAITVRAVDSNHTGSWMGAGGATLQAGPLLPHKADEWFVLEVIAEDNHIRTLVDGQPAADYLDENRRFSRGHIALQTWGPSITSVQFRKIEIKELPASAAAPDVKTPPLADAPFTDADVQRIAALPAEQQVAAVVASLKERNPGLNGASSHKIVDGVVTEFNFIPADGENALTDLSPVRALAGLTSLNLWSCSALADLGPLQGLPLTKLLIGSLDVSNQVRDLKPLQGMRLTELQLYQCQVEDLKPLAGMPLNRLRVFSRQVRDCEPLKGMPLTTLDLSYCSQIQDFTPLTGLPLTVLHLNGCQIRDLQPLLGLKLTEVSLAGTRVQDLQQLKGMPLKNLAIHRTAVTDLTPLQGMELKEIFLNPKNITEGLNHLRDMQSLHTIGIGYTSKEKWPAAEFWDRYDKEEFAPVPFTDADAKRIAALPAAEQVEEVRKELIKRNPGFDGSMAHKIENGVVTELRVVTDQVTDIAPVRVFNSLQVLDLSGTQVNFVGNGQLADLSPLIGMNLAGLGRLHLNFTMVGDEGLVHFKDCKKLTLLTLDTTQVSDTGLAYFKDYTDLTYLNLNRLKISDAGLAHFKNCKNLKFLQLGGSPVGDAGLSYFKECEHLTLLGLSKTRVTDGGLAHFKDCKKLVNLALMATPITNAGLAHFKDSKELTRLHIGYTKVTDLSLIKGMPLKELDCPFRPERDAEILRSIKTLETINGKPAAEFWERYEKGEFAVAPFTDIDVQRIAALPAIEQVEEVRKELLRRNPGFDGKLTPTIENGVVTQLSINTDEILDISPVRALAGLVYLDCRGTYPNKGKLSDLLPLKGMAISRLDCSSTQVRDLTPLAGLPLTYLHFNHNPVSEILPLQGMPLLELGLAETEVSDLAPLKGMKLQVLGAQLLPVTDLSPLAGIPLKALDLYHTIGVTSLEPLRGMPLDGLNLQDVPVSDLSPLAGMTTLRTLLLQGNKVTDLTPLQGLKLTSLLLHDNQISDLSPLKGMPLIRLEVDGTSVSDLTPVKGMPLQEIRLRPQNITQGLEILRGIKTLKTIGIDGNQAWPTAEFWERLDKGEFK